MPYKQTIVTLHNIKNSVQPILNRPNGKAIIPSQIIGKKCEYLIGALEHDRDLYPNSCILLILDNTLKDAAKKTTEYKNKISNEDLEILNYALKSIEGIITNIRNNDCFQPELAEEAINPPLRQVC